MSGNLNCAAAVIGMLLFAAPARMCVGQEPPKQAETGTPAMKEGPKITIDVRWDPRSSDLRNLLPRFLNQKRFIEAGMKVPVYPVLRNNTPYSATISIGSVLEGQVDEAAIRAAQREYVKMLTAALNAEHERILEERALRRERARAELDKAEATAAKADEELRTLRQELRKVSGRIDVSPEGIANAATGLEQEAQKIAIDTTAQEARKKALEEAVARLSAQGQERAKTDPIATELSKILEARTKEMQLMEKLREEGRVSATEFLAIQPKVAEARIRLLERQEALSRGGDTDLVRQLNSELLTLSINLAEQQARRESVMILLRRFEEASPLLDRVEQLIRRRAEAHQLREERRTHVREAETNSGDLRAPLVETTGLEGGGL